MSECSGIYAIEHIASQRKYIGSSDNIPRRWKHHVNALLKNKHANAKLQSAWNKYSCVSFQFLILEASVPVSKLIEREQHWMDSFGVVTNGFNLAPVAGSVRGIIPSKEVREKLAAAKRGIPRTSETRAKISAYQKSRSSRPGTGAKISAAKMGHIVSDESRQKMSLAKKGKKQSPEAVAKRAASCRANSAARKAQQ